MPGEHARLSPSSAHRWINCPASVLLAEEAGQVPDEGSEYAEEGTRAHVLCEIEASHHFGWIDDLEYRRRKDTWRMTLVGEHEETDMQVAADGYVIRLQQIVDANPGAVVLLEQRMDTGVPESWGTGDAIIIAPGLIHVVDVKYGTGIRVEVVDNPQLMLYGVAALDTFEIIGEVDEVCVEIYQPRLQHDVVYCLKATDLRAWRDSIIPVAEAALQGGAEFGPSEEACRWCPVAGECSARARFIAVQEFGEPTLLSPEQMAEAKRQIPNIRKWCDQVEARALSKAYRDGVKIPGYKVVRSDGRRKVVDPPHAIQVLIDNGFTAEQVAKVGIRSFEDLERLLPKDELNALLGDLIQKSEGKPTLVPEDDKREEINVLGEESKAFKVIEQ
jgi:hypothetical protein